jgi:hypothetical protein
MAAATIESASLLASVFAELSPMAQKTVFFSLTDLNKYPKVKVVPPECLTARNMIPRRIRGWGPFLKLRGEGSRVRMSVGITKKEKILFM